MAQPVFAANVPVPKAGAEGPGVNASEAASILVLDTASGKTLYAMNPGKQWPAASLTKLMTAHLFAAGRSNWTKKGNIVGSDEVGGGRLNVAKGSVMTYRDLLYSAIAGSANNAANALARLSGRGYAGFVKEMNRRALSLGLTNTFFVDASGMNPKNVSTAHDIALILGAASENSEIHRAMVSPVYTFTIAKPKRLVKTIKNTNRLLFAEPDVIVTAGKTGYLEESMYNYAVKVRPKSGAGGELAIVVFGASSRNQSVDDAAALAKWAWDAFVWSGTSTIPVRFSRNLGSGDRGTDVKALQAALNANGFPVASAGPGSPGRETDKFGPLTRAAVKKFQDAHVADVLETQGRKKGSGVVDYATRAVLNEL